MGGDAHKKATALDLPKFTDLDDNESFVYTPSGFTYFLNLLLCRSNATVRLKYKPVSIFGLFRYAEGRERVLLFLAVLCAIASGASKPVLCLISGRIANIFMTVPVTSNHFRKTAFDHVFIFLGIGVFLVISNYFQYMAFQGVCVKIIARNRAEYVRAVLRQNAGWFDKHHAGAISTALNDEMERIREGIGDKLGLLIRGFSMIVFAILVSFLYEWRITFIMLGVVPTTLGCMTLLTNIMTKSTEAEMAGVGRAGAIAEEAIMGVRTVQAFNGQQEMVDKYRSALASGQVFAMKKGIWSGILGGAFFFWLFTFNGVGALFGAHLLRIQEISEPGNVLVCILAIPLASYFLGLISPHMLVLLNARVAAAHIYHIIDRTPVIDAYSTTGTRPSNIKGKVEFKNIHFRYPSRPEAKILNGLNLTINPGETVALVGHSGCGKSTSVGLLTRLYECESGAVTIDGHSVQEVNIDWLRTVVGIVQQEPILFTETIAENLRMGNPEATREMMEKCCKMANAHDFIVKMPHGYDTLIGDGGVQLSGGQKQRVAIARTLIRDPKILLLDEATSALDAESESIVQSALDNASAGRSTIVIAHRLSTIRNADKIVYFEKGEIAEMGTHHELVDLGGKYYDLVKAQQFKPEAGEEEGDWDEVDVGGDGLCRQSSITQSIRSGRDAFVRADSIASHSAAQQAAESAAFAEEVGRVMARDGKVTAGLLDIWKNAGGSYGTMILGYAFAIARGMELPALGLCLSFVFEAFQMTPWGDRMMHRMCMGLIIFCSVGVGCWITQIFATYFFTLTSNRLMMKFRIAAFSNILYQDASYFDNPHHAPGKLITRLATDAPNVRAVTDERMLQVIYGLTSVAANIAIAFGFCWQVALLGTCTLILLASVMLGCSVIILRFNMQLIKNDNAGKMAIEIIENVRTIQLLTRCEYFYTKYEKASNGQKRNELKKAWIEAINFSLSQAFTYLMMCLCYALGTYICHEEKKRADFVFRTINAMLLGAVSVMNTASFFPEFVKAKSAAGMLFNIIDRKPMTGDLTRGDRPTLRGNIMFENVKFSYPQRALQPIMKGLNWTALRGQTVALVGPSGSGKSTCIGMLERFYDVTGGTLRLDGQDIRNLSLEHVRTQMALVGQEPRLFVGTIKDNVLFGLDKQAVPLEKIMEALRLANATNFLKNLPAGIDTEVGEKGSMLSGGQKQRIAIARALIRDPKILLLDEATSALDSESERAVQEALDTARQGRTCVTIAHRLSSIQNSDLIVYIAGGKVQESGTHSQLMKMRGKYFDLIQKQDLS